MKDGALMDKTLVDLQKEIIVEVKKGFPILLSGAVVFYFYSHAFSFANRSGSFKLDIWLRCHFPIGLGISKILGINLNATGNPLGTLGGSLPLLKLLHTCIYHCVYEHT